jgi:8-oxo-dGTP pyrophosphatase MutT (NUDIX family)
MTGGSAPGSHRPFPIDPRLVPVSHRDGHLPAVDIGRLSPQALRARFTDPPVWTPEFTRDRSRPPPPDPTDASVLVPIVKHESGLTVLLTERAAHLRQHAGQIAFPGGRRDAEDRTPIDTALREAAEEVGIDAGFVEVLGLMPHYWSGTGYRITPVVALLEPGFTVRSDPTEVAAVFEVPLVFLMNPGHHERRRIRIDDLDRDFYAMPFRHDEHQREYFIWGATAAMLRNLYRLLSA